MSFLRIFLSFFIPTLRSNCVTLTLSRISGKFSPMRIPGILICLLTAAQPLLAQPTQKKYTRANFIKDSTEIMRVKLIKPQFRVDNRNIFFKGQVLTLNGIDAGVILNEKLRLTAGYYQLNDNLSAYKTEINGMQVDRHLKLNYGSLNTEFIYKSARFYSLGMPMEFGFGSNKLTYQNALDNYVYESESGFVILADFGLSGTFKPIRWIGIKGVVGYRKSVLNQVKDFHFDGVFTSVGLNLDIWEFVKDVKMYKLKKKYKRINSPVGTAVDLITD
jgi:hypothetical protein